MTSIFFLFFFHFFWISFRVAGRIVDQLGLLAPMAALVNVATLGQELDSSSTATATETRWRRRTGRGRVVQRWIQRRNDASIRRDADSFFHFERNFHEYHPRSLLVDSGSVQGGGRSGGQRSAADGHGQTKDFGAVQEFDPGSPSKTTARRRADVFVAIAGTSGRGRWRPGHGEAIAFGRFRFHDSNPLAGWHVHRHTWAQSLHPDDTGQHSRLAPIQNERVIDWKRRQPAGRPIEIGARRQRASRRLQ